MVFPVIKAAAGAAGLIIIRLTEMKGMIYHGSKFKVKEYILKGVYSLKLPGNVRGSTLWLLIRIPQ